MSHTFFTLRRLSPLKHNNKAKFAWLKQLTRAAHPNAGLLTEKEAAAWLGSSISTLRRIRKTGKIGYCQILGGVRYSVQHLQNYINSVSK